MTQTAARQAGRPVVWNHAGPVEIPERPKAARPLAAVRREPGQSWYRIRNQADGTAEIWLYDEIGMWGVSAGMFVEELTALRASAITLHINSPGGEVWDGLAIYNALKAHPAPVTVRVDGAALSAASFIAQAGDRIVTARQSQWMIHDASGLCVGNEADMTSMALILDQLSTMIAEIYHDRAAGGVTKWRNLMRAESWYTAQEAVDVGLADEVAALPKREEDEALAARAQWNLSVFHRPPADLVAAPVRPAAVAPEPAAPAEPAEPAPEPAPLDLAALRTAFRDGLAVAGRDVGAPDVPAPVEPEPEPAPEPEPEPETEPETVGDTALAAAEFRDRMAAAASTMPAAPARAFPATPRTTNEPDRPPAEPGPAEQPMALAEWFTAAVELGVTSVSAPSNSAPADELEPEPAPTIDPAAFRAALKGATL